MLSGSTAHAFRLDTSLHLILWPPQQAAMPLWLGYQQQRQKAAQCHSLTFAQPTAEPAAEGDAGRGRASA